MDSIDLQSLANILIRNGWTVTPPSNGKSTVKKRMPLWKTASTLAVGDLLDLQGDSQADPKNNKPEYQFEYVQVDHVDTSCDEFVVVTFTDDTQICFDTFHKVKCAER